MSNAINPNLSSFALGQMLGQLVTKAVTVDSNQDGKISSTELMSFLISLVLELTKNFSQIPLAVKELKSPTNEAHIALVAGIKEKFDIPDDELEALIEDTLEVLLQIFSLVTDWKEFLSQPK
jgi:hypothetical protein